MSGETDTAPKKSRIGLTAAACTLFVVGMVGMSFAAVPLYRMFCQVTGFGGTPLRADAAPEGTIDREVTVRFDANIGNGLGWSFRPLERQIRLRVGEVAEVRFLVENRGRETSTGTATFNVSPDVTGAYFNKLACFCFSEQTLKAGERVEMPVQFFIDPAIAEDKDLNYIDAITLSYTFYPAREPAKPLASVARPGEGNNPL
jgi:cytochrome c oxidase assembly protein subunit 11